MWQASIHAVLLLFFFTALLSSESFFLNIPFVLELMTDINALYSFL